MFAAIGRYLRAFGYLITGRIDAARRTLAQSPHVIRATYDRVIEEKTKQIGQYKEAVAGMIAQQEKKISRVKTLTSEIENLNQLREGAAAKAKSVVAELKAKGVSMEDIKANEEYMRCLSAFNDFSHSIEEKTAHASEFEGDINELGENIGGHKVQLQQLLRDIEKLKEEAHQTVADVITAKEEQKIADMISGISEDRYSKELQELRELRDQQKAKARISREIAGTDTKQQESEFLEYARKSAASDEFDRLIGLADEAESETSEPAEEAKRQTQLPEE